MFEIIRSHKRLVQVLLALVFLPFAFFGIDAAWDTPNAEAVATVGDARITPQALEEASRGHLASIKQQLGASYDDKRFNTPEIRRFVLEGLISQELLQQEAKNLNMPIEAIMRRMISGIPEFQKDGAFSRELYEQRLQSQGRSVAEFEAEVRRYLLEQQPPLLVSLNATAIISQTSVDQLLKLLSEERAVRTYNILPAAFVDQVKLPEDAAQKYYNANQKSFVSPEQLRAELLTMSLQSLDVSNPTQEEISAWYESNKNLYQTPEERRVSHILLAIDANTDEDTKAEIRANLEQILKTARAQPEQFDALAKTHSQDSGSAQSGGDLGVIARGEMVRPFEEAAYALEKVGTISDIVTTEFGYHIIKLTSLKPAHLRPLQDVKTQIAGDLKQQAAARQFAASADDFSNLVYEQSDSLQPAAEKYKLNIQQSKWFSRDDLSGLPPSYQNHELIKALFGSESIEEKRNTEVIEIAPKVLVAARVLEHKPSEQIPYPEVEQQITKQLTQEAASRLAREDGEAKLVKLQAGDDELNWGAIKKASQLSPVLDTDSTRVAFGMNTETLPAYAGVVLPDNSYTLLKLEARSTTDLQALQKQQLQNRIQQALKSQFVGNYIQALRQRYEVSINHELLADDRE